MYLGIRCSKVFQFKDLLDEHLSKPELCPKRPPSPKGPHPDEVNSKPKPVNEESNVIQEPRITSSRLQEKTYLPNSSTSSLPVTTTTASTAYNHLISSSSTSVQTSNVPSRMTPSFKPTGGNIETNRNFSVPPPMMRMPPYSLSKNSLKSLSLHGF